MVSYQMPASALAKSGLSANTSPRTIVVSMISPGILLESKIFFGVRPAFDLGQLRIPGDDRRRVGGFVCADDIRIRRIDGGDDPPLSTRPN